MATQLLVDDIARAWEEEGLFARDVNGQLIRAVEATAKQYSEFVTVTIDGQPISVPRATPAVDSQGNILFLDASGRTQPRPTTVLDARNALAQQRKTDEHCIPTVCHAVHLQPVGVCRICSVAVAKRDASGRISLQDKLVPACVQPVQPGMLVFTLDGPAEAIGNLDPQLLEAANKAKQRVRTNVKTLLELLAADHLETAPGKHSSSDLESLVSRLESRGMAIDRSRWSPRQRAVIPQNSHTALPMLQDRSSPLIHVNHEACILCDRCVRSCSDVKQNFVIGRTGKGYATRIGFDLDAAMGTSSCVECGECALACPTTALTFVKPPEEPEWWLAQVGGVNSVTRERFKGIRGKTAVTPESLAGHRYFGLLSERQRQWFQYSIVRWELQPGDELCRKGEYGFTAFLLESGRFDGWLRDPREEQGGSTPGSWGNLWNWLGAFSKQLPTTEQLGPPDFERDESALIMGEMTLISHLARSATLRAKTPAVVYEIRRNVLYALQRHPAVREEFDKVYRGRALGDVLKFVPDRSGRQLSNRLFGELNEADLQTCRRFLEQASHETVSPQSNKRKVDLIRVEPGQVICQQDEQAEDFFIIRLGNVKVAQSIAGEERVIDYFRPSHSFGEIACVAGWEQLPADVTLKSTANRRTATCTALDDVELIRIDKQTFRDLLEQVPALLQIIAKRAQQLQTRSQAKPVSSKAQSSTNSPILREFTEQGLYNAQRLLVLDLEACTRCDECTKACADTHGGVTRLIREGLRFDKWLVASSCRSCTDPYCLVGCPVDAIHRDGERLEIKIEQHCIGCGLCAKNCPYGNINMHEQHHHGHLSHVATTCDLCAKIVGPQEAVSCVFACPHNASFRMSGEALLSTIEGYRPL